MFRVDVENILRQCTNVHDARNRYPNSVTNTDHEHDDFKSNEFRMYSFKIKKCPLNRAHDWTICPYAHIGERARRRDPLHVPYMAVSCTDYKATGGTCPRGDLCEYAHGVFEYWLHPAKYRTRICNAGIRCSRPVCFFAHKSDEIRIEPTIRIPNWAHQHIQREMEAQVTNMAKIKNNIGYGHGLGVTGRHVMSNTPNPLIFQPSGSGRANTTTGERPQELRSEFLEGLRMMRISDNYTNYNNQVVQNTKVETNEDFDMPNVDWVTDLLLG